MHPTLVLVLCVLGGCVGFAMWIASRVESAAPNQWLILLRGGRPIKAGVGIWCWRLPGDTVARFTSTMQRVTFETEVYTEDKQHIKIEGFVLWAVSDEEGAPFRAFSRLGIAHREATPRGATVDPTSHHALSRPQHHAFRRSIEAVARKSAVKHPLRELLSAPEQLAAAIQEGLLGTTQPWGISLEAVEVTQLQVTQEELFSHLQAPYIEQSRKEAISLKLEADAQIATMRRTAEKQEALESATLQRQKEQELARIELERQEQRNTTREAELLLAQKEQEMEREWQEQQRDATHQQALQASERKQALALAQEEHARALMLEEQKRLDAQADAERDRRARSHEQEHKHQEDHLKLEASKPDAVRAAELSQAIVSAAAQGLRHLPLREIKWFSQDASQGPTGLFHHLIDTIEQTVQSARSFSPSSEKTELSSTKE